ncbi:hypothetical protein [Armatimonas sp.]|uniref:hypothetical protein n=1 Tax=Armatimonas sp. TaxID=1872638 RepID=UPI00286A4969|nr:hypothetical protein [Armatimonas sp.]
MKSRLTNSVGSFFLGALAVSASVAVALAPKKLVLNGKVVSTGVITQGSESYVPVRDIASALGMSVRAIDGGFELYREGGANRVEGLNGKLGEMLFDGIWRLKVKELKEVGSYTDRFTPNRPRTHMPKSGEKLLILELQVRNGQKEQSYLDLNLADNKIVTALTDTEGHSYPVRMYDMRTGSGQPFGGGGNWDQSESILPGAAYDFVAVASVPRDFAPKDMVFTLCYAKLGVAKKYSNFRISLVKE